MARDASTVRVGFLGDASQLAREAQRAQRSVAAVGTSAEAMGRRMGKAFAVGVAGAATAAVALGKSAISAASDLNESLSKNQAVFGQSAGAVQSWANDSQKNILLTRQAAIEGAATFGNLFTSMGIGQGAAADLSTKLVGLASDLSSFNNVGTDEALVALRSGLLGEAEPLRKFGVQLSAARIEAEAFALGLAKPVKNAAAIQSAQIKVAAATANVAKVEKEHGKGTLAAAKARDALAHANAGLTKAMAGQKTELTAAQKTQAAYSIILKDTQTAQGDAARTSGGYANQTRILHKRISDLSAELGVKLMPYVQRVVEWLNRMVTEFQAGTGDGGRLRDTLSGLAQNAKAVGDALIPVIRFLADHQTVFRVMAEGVAAFILVAKINALVGVATALTGIGAGGTAAAGGIAAAGGAAALALPELVAIAAALTAAIEGAKMYNGLAKNGAFNVDSPDYAPNDPNLAPYAPNTGGMRNADGSFTPDPKPGKAVSDARQTDKDDDAARKRARAPKVKQGTVAEQQAKNAAAAASTVKKSADTTAKAQQYAADKAQQAADAKAKAADALNAATEKLRDALTERMNVAKGVRDSLVSSNSVVREGVSWTAKDLLSRFTVTMQKVRRFSQALQTMARKGYSTDIIQQVAAAGVQGGMGTAVGLANASGAQVRQFNAVQGSINRASAYAGNAVGGSMGPIQITTKVMLNDRELATAVNRYNARMGSNGSLLSA